MASKRDVTHQIIDVQGPDETVDCWYCEGRGETGFAHTGYRTCRDCDGTGRTTRAHRMGLQLLVASAEGRGQRCAWTIVDGEEMCIAY